MIEPFGEDVKRVIAALVRSENALCLTDFVEMTTLPVSRVAAALDFLVMVRIFKIDHSFHRTEVGEIVYLFAENDEAQAVFNAFEEADGEGGTEKSRGRM